MTQTSSDWYVLATAAGYVGRDETDDLVVDVPLSDAAAFATEGRANHAAAYVAVKHQRMAHVHAVDAAWVHHRFGTIPA